MRSYTLWGAIEYLSDYPNETEVIGAHDGRNFCLELGDDGVVSITSGHYDTSGVPIKAMFVSPKSLPSNDDYVCLEGDPEVYPSWFYRVVYNTLHHPSEASIYLVPILGEPDDATRLDLTMVVNGCIRFCTEDEVAYLKQGRVPHEHDPDDLFIRNDTGEVFPRHRLNKDFNQELYQLCCLSGQRLDSIRTKEKRVPHANT